MNLGPMQGRVGPGLMTKPALWLTITVSYGRVSNGKCMLKFDVSLERYYYCTFHNCAAWETLPE